MKLSPHIIDGDVIRLRPFQPHDFQDFLQLVCDEEVFRYASSGFKKDLVEAEQSFQRHLKRMKRGSTYKIDWVIERVADGAFLGRASLHHPESDSVRLGVFLFPDFWGKGYGTAAVKLLFRAAGDYGFRKVIASVHPQNLSSQRMLEKAGMMFLRTVPDFLVKKGMRVERKVYQWPHGQ